MKAETIRLTADIMGDLPFALRPSPWREGVPAGQMVARVFNGPGGMGFAKKIDGEFVGAVVGGVLTKGAESRPNQRIALKLVSLTTVDLGASQQLIASDLLLSLVEGARVKRFKAVDALGDRRSTPESGALPMEFLLKHGFRPIRWRPRYPTCRLDIGSVAFVEDIMRLFEKFRASLREPELRPGWPISGR